MLISERDYSIIVDTREQKPWKFRGLKENKNKQEAEIYIEVKRHGLTSGDYSIYGHENKIAIERKSKADLFFCMGKDRERFERQVQRLNETVDLPYVFVEASWESIMMGCDTSKLLPKVVFRTRASWEQKYPKVKWYFLPTVRVAEAQAFRVFDTYWRHLTEGN